MFHTLSELKDKENTKKEGYKNKNSPEDKYYGKGNQSYVQYNKKTSEEIDEQFEKTKNKVKLIVYKNGFILNNGPFRDRSIPENDKFMKEVEKGNIPQELIKKGITDLGILLENRKTEIYNPSIIGVIPITHITQINQINPINPFNINPYNQFNQYNQIPFHGYNILNNPSQYNFPFQYQNPYIIYNNPYGAYTVIPRGRSRTQVWNPPQTPMGTRNVKNNIFIPNTDNRNNIQRTDRNTCSVPKEDNKSRYNRKNFQTFESFKNLEALKEEEKKKDKKQKTKNNNDKEDEKKEEDKKKFTAFEGSGKVVGYANIVGLNVNKDVKNIVDIYRPVCKISIRLFNGEIIKADFNYTQTLRDIYFYVGKISGSNNFTLLDGFPPRTLTAYNRTIGELKIENSILTQKIN